MPYIECASSIAECDDIIKRGQVGKVVSHLVSRLQLNTISSVMSPLTVATEETSTTTTTITYCTN
jgi:hypothetical protein